MFNGRCNGHRPPLDTRKSSFYPRSSADVQHTQNMLYKRRMGPGIPRKIPNHEFRRAEYVKRQALSATGKYIRERPKWKKGVDNTYENMARLGNENAWFTVEKARQQDRDRAFYIRPISTPDNMFSRQLNVQRNISKYTNMRPTWNKTIEELTHQDYSTRQRTVTSLKPPNKHLMTFLTKGELSHREFKDTFHRNPRPIPGISPASEDFHKLKRISYNVRRPEYYQTTSKDNDGTRNVLRNQIDPTIRQIVGCNKLDGVKHVFGSLQTAKPRHTKRTRERIMHIPLASNNALNFESMDPRAGRDPMRNHTRGKMLTNSHAPPPPGSFTTVRPSEFKNRISSMRPQTLPKSLSKLVSPNRLYNARYMMRAD